MRQLFYACLFFGMGTAQAQITITRSDMPQSGDTARVMNAAITPNLATRLAATGADFEWNFADLQPQTDELHNYRAGLQTPYFYFLTAYGREVQESVNLLVINLEQLYDFYSLNNNRFAVTGKGFTLTGLPLPAFFSDADEMFFLPLTYQRNDSSTFAYGLDIPTVGEYSSRGGRKTEVDGWGSITTPTGTYDCLRVKSTLRIADSITFNGFNIGLPQRTEVQYYWLSKGEKAPILKATGNSFFGQFTPNLIQYRYNAANVPPTIQVGGVKAGEMRVYPNPANEVLFLAVNSLDRIETVSFYDAFGKLVKFMEGYSATGIELRDLQSGLYNIQVTSQYGVYTEKALIIPR